MVKKFVVDGVRVSDGGVVPKELRGIAAKLVNGEEVLKLLKQVLALIEKNLLMCCDNSETLFEPFHSFFRGLQGVIDVEDFVVDLVHAIGECASV